jgi:hypothetical protein
MPELDCGTISRIQRREDHEEKNPLISPADYLHLVFKRMQPALEQS